MTTRRKRLLTIPNLLSLLRLCLIPVFVYLYHQEQYWLTAITLVISGITDLVDGWYARRFNAVSDIGKVLDPIADKLTQAAMLLCLVSDHRQMLVPLILLIIKEMIAALSGLAVIRATGCVPGAIWHGKAATLLLYLLMIVHVIWKDIPLHLSNLMTGVCVAMMLMSMTLYTVRNVRSICAAGKGGA